MCGWERMRIAVNCNCMQSSRTRRGKKNFMMFNSYRWRGDIWHSIDGECMRSAFACTCRRSDITIYLFFSIIWAYTQSTSQRPTLISLRTHRTTLVGSLHVVTLYFIQLFRDVQPVERRRRSDRIILWSMKMKEKKKHFSVKNSFQK